MKEPPQIAAFATSATEVLLWVLSFSSHGSH
jgi:hypothetical protein